MNTITDAGGVIVMMKQLDNCVIKYKMPSGEYIDIVDTALAEIDVVENKRVDNLMSTSTFSAEIRINSIDTMSLHKMCGIYDYIISSSCRTKIAKLAEHGKNRRIRKKNYKRLLKIMEA